MNAVRKEFLRRLGYIGIAVFVAISQTLIDDRKPYRYISVAVILFVLFHFVHIAIKSQQFIDDFFTPKVKKETTTTPTNKLIDNISMVLFFGGLLGIIFESTAISNTIHGTKFFWIGGVMGIVLFIIMIIFLKSKLPTVFDDSSRRYSVYFGYLFGLFLITPAIASYINITFAQQAEEWKTYFVSGKGIEGAKATEYYIICNLDGSKEKFIVKKSLWENLEENKTVEICLRKGFFGYAYVTEFKLNNVTNINQH